jgi:hypothetical protein
MTVVTQNKLPADIGIKGSLNLSKLNFSEKDADHWKSITGFQVGIFYNLKLIKNFLFQPEIYYVKKGVTLSDTFGGMEIRSTVRFNYVEIPLLLKMVFPNKSSFYPSIFIGRYWAFNTNIKNILEYGSTRTEEDIKGQIAKMDYGWVAGISAEWQMGWGNLVLDIRYNLGLKSINQITLANYSVKIRSIALMVGYSF